MVVAWRWQLCSLWFPLPSLFLSYHPKKKGQRQCPRFVGIFLSRWNVEAILVISITFPLFISQADVKAPNKPIPLISIIFTLLHPFLFSKSLKHQLQNNANFIAMTYKTNHKFKSIPNVNIRSILSQIWFSIHLCPCRFILLFPPIFYT